MVVLNHGDAGLLLRNHVETLPEFLKRSESDSGFQRALRRDLEGARDVQPELWGQQRLESLLRSCGSSTPAPIMERILHEMTTFAKDQRQRDDVTLKVMNAQEECDV